MRVHRPLRNPRYIWQLPDWPHFSYDAAALTAALAQVHRAQGQWMGRKAELGMTQRAQATSQVLTQEVLKTSEIEGERLNLDTVRSSIARRLGLDIGALFPTGYSGRPRITVAGWRLDASGPRDVVSGAVDRENVHFTAPPAATLAAHTDTLLQWFEAAPAGDALIKVALAHLWLVTLHPFDDGNGRISRAVSDMALARAEEMSAAGPPQGVNAPTGGSDPRSGGAWGQYSHQRFYSFSAQIQRERKDYYGTPGKSRRSAACWTALKASSPMPSGRHWAGVQQIRCCAISTSCWRAGCCTGWRVAGGVAGMH